MNSIFAKLFWSCTGLIAGAFFLFGVVYLSLLHLQLFDDFEQQFADKADTLEAVLAQADASERENRIVPLLEGRGYHVRLEMNDGSVYGNGEVPSGSGSSGGWDDGSLQYVVYGPIAGGTAAVVFEDLEQQYLQTVFWMGLSFLIVIGVAAGVVWWMARRMTDPLRQMNQHAEAVSRGEFDHRLTVEKQDEIGSLAASLNTMSAELSKLEEARQTFFSGISHDLRSPLTTVKGFLTALEDGAVPDPERPRCYRIMQKETDRTIGLVEDILELTRLQAGMQPPELEIYDVYEQLLDERERLKPELEEKQLTLRVTGKSVEINADPDQMQRVWRNLLINAAAHSPAGSVIEVKIQGGSRPQVTITDEGPGIGGIDPERLWDRFYKSDPARSAHSGTGLGLSIVKVILDQHGAEIEAEDHPRGGAVFTVRL